MHYELDSKSGEKIIIDWSDDGNIIYSVDNRETRFKAEECLEYIFKSVDGTSHIVKAGEDGVKQLDIVILRGEHRLEKTTMTVKQESITALTKCPINMAR